MYEIGFQIHQFIKSYRTTIIINYSQGITMKTDKLMFAPALLILSGVVNAESFNYDYIDTNIIRYDLESSTSKSHYDGYLVSASMSVSDNIHLLAEYTNTNDDSLSGNLTLNLDFKTVGFGANYPLFKYENTDIVVDFLHTRWNNSLNGTSISASAGGKFNSIDVGIRNQFSDNLEINARLERHDLAGDNNLYKAFSAGAIYKINNNFSLKFKGFRAKDSEANSTDWDGREIGIRYYF